MTKRPRLIIIIQIGINNFKIKNFMENFTVFEKRNYDILWDRIELSPSIQLKDGIRKKVFPLKREKTDKREQLDFKNDFVELKGKWDNSPGFGSLLSLKLTNISKKTIRLTRLVFPAENGLDDFLKDFSYFHISFLRNGYQSWSTTRSYKVMDKPLRPWLQIVSLTSSNMANLPSNTPGNLSSEMFSVITDSKKNESFLIGQTAPFNQFLYIRLILFKTTLKKSHFEIVYDFGRKLINPGESIQLDGIVMAKGDTIDLQSKYFAFIKNQMNIKVPKKNIKGWSSWYYYYNKITPEIIYQNMEVIKEKFLDINLIQIDDGYQKYVGDWLDLNPQFNDKMKELANNIKESGFIPGIWIAPFIADKRSELVKNYPEYVLKTDYGIPIVAGYNPMWQGKFYYGLDITNPSFEEYIRYVIRTIVREWGFKYIKLDFLYGGCLRGANHINFRLSRSEVLKYGMKIIREEAGKDAILIGCGMPLSTGIGTVNAMRVGPDTAPYWKKMIGGFLQTGAMICAKNSMRNFIVRSFMHKNLWLNDPDCIMMRNTKTRLNKYERMTCINSVIISGGLLLFSDNLLELTDLNFFEMDKINKIMEKTYTGNALPIDIMEKEIPEIYYNTSGFIGIFNFKNVFVNKAIDFKKISAITNNITILKDIWTEERFELNNGVLELIKIPPHSSMLFKIL